MPRLCLTEKLPEGKNPALSLENSPLFKAVFHVVMLIHGLLGLELAVAFCADERMLRVVMLIPRGLSLKLAIAPTALEATVYRVIVLIHRLLAGEFAVALGAFETMLCVIVLIHRILVRKLAVTLGTPETMLYVIVLIHRLLSSKFAIALGALYQAVNFIVVLIPSRLRREFIFAIRVVASKAVFRVVVLGKCQRMVEQRRSKAEALVHRVAVLKVSMRYYPAQCGRRVHLVCYMFICCVPRCKDRPADVAYESVFRPEVRG